MSELLPEVLTRRASSGDRAYVFLNEDGTERATLTYRELHERALDVAAQLAARCVPGDRALLVFPQSLDFIVAYFGCLYARVIGVPVNPPRGNRIQDATASIARDCRPAAVLSTGAQRDVTRAALEPVSGPVQWIAVDEVPRGDFQPRPCGPDDLAFLQYTSGSTAEPKGVMVSHGNLAANQRMIRDAFGHDEDSTVVGWAPFFHDQGLIGNVLQPLYVGATAVLMSPMAFVRRPLRWLEAISRYRAHTSGGPNFAFDACVDSVARGRVPELDLSCWRVAFNGAEPIQPETLRRFADAFASFGFDPAALYPCYGLAEATLLVTGSRKGRGPRTIRVDADALGEGRYVPSEIGRELAGSGEVVEGGVRIVDPETGRPCPSDQVGEIWVSGDHVARGYWRRSVDTFQAECDGRRYLRTGDLGMLVGGELYMVGRRKDLVIIRGRNYYPQDIERTVVAAHPAVRPGGCAAFGVSGGTGEKLVVIAEIRREERHTAEPGEVGAAIRAAVIAEHQLSLGGLLLTMSGRLPKTSSGKIMRAAARQRYLAREFEVWTPAPIPVD